MFRCMCVWWASVGVGLHSGGLPKSKMSNSGRFMWVSRPFRFNYELITRLDHSAGRRRGVWGGETKENNNREDWGVEITPKAILSAHWWMPKNITHGGHLNCKTPLDFTSLIHTVNREMRLRHLTWSYMLSIFEINGWFEFANNFKTTMKLLGGHCLAWGICHLGQLLLIIFYFCLLLRMTNSSYLLSFTPDKHSRVIVIKRCFLGELTLQHFSGLFVGEHARTTFIDHLWDCSSLIFIFCCLGWSPLRSILTRNVYCCLKGCG